MFNLASSHKYLWSFNYYAGYGSVMGMFVASKEEMDLVFGLGTIPIDFGECLGKHSEVIAYLDLSNFKCIEWTRDLSSSQKADLEIGYSPLFMYISRYLNSAAVTDGHPSTHAEVVDFCKFEKIPHLADYFYAKLQ